MVAEIEDRHFRDALDNVQLLTVMLDAVGKVTYCNDSLARLLGCTREQVIGLNWFDTFVPPNQGAVKRIFFMSMLKGEIAGHYANDIVTRDGRRRFISWHNTLRLDERGCVMGTTSIGEDVTDRMKEENTLSSYKEQLRKLAAELSMAEERERCRLAGELHDQVGQSLALTKIRLMALNRKAAPDDAAAFSELAALIDGAIRDIRSMTFQLCSRLLYEVGLEAALERLAESLGEEHGFSVVFLDDKLSKPLSEEMKVALYQVVREIFCNIVKHASASRVRISIRRLDSAIAIQVEDDGAGFNVALAREEAGRRRGFGLFNIHQRIEYLGGQVAIESEIGCGTSARVVAPLKSSGDWGYVG